MIAAVAAILPAVTVAAAGAAAGAAATAYFFDTRLRCIFAHAGHSTLSYVQSYQVFFLRPQKLFWQWLFWF
jgi:hypothetical protein